MVQRALRLRRPRRGLRDLGYIEGKNILVEFRSAEGKLDRLFFPNPKIS
jgi:putative tryptophan/tyrosine transport system substrate-binding protein